MREVDGLVHRLLFVLQVLLFLERHDGLVYRMDVLVLESSLREY